jgi:hypothetical protein
MKQDASTIPPQVSAGRTYQGQVWAKGSGPVSTVTYYRNATGNWVYWQTGPRVNLTGSWAQYSFTTAAVPTGTTAVSFGLALVGVGNLTTDDYSLVDTAA